MAYVKKGGGKTLSPGYKAPSVSVKRVSKDLGIDDDDPRSRVYQANLAAKKAAAAKKDLFAEREKTTVPQQVVAEVDDDFGSLAQKLGVDEQALVQANKDAYEVKAGTVYDVPQLPLSAITGNISPEDQTFIKNLEYDVKRFESGQELQDYIATPQPSEPETPKKTPVKDFFERGITFDDVMKLLQAPGVFAPLYDVGEDGTSSLPSGVGQGAGAFIPPSSQTMTGDAPEEDSTRRFLEGALGERYSPSSEVGIGSGTYDTGVSSGTYDEQELVGHGMWEDHNYWEGHVDPYRLAIDLALEEGIDLPPHPSENMNYYLRDGHMDEYLTDIRAWEDNAYGGQRPSMVDILKYDDVLYDKLMNDQLTSGDLLELHRELPAYSEQFYGGGMENWPVEDQQTYDILGKLGYIPNVGGGTGAYIPTSRPSWGSRAPLPFSGIGGGSSGQKPNYQRNNAYLSLTSWRI